MYDAAYFREHAEHYRRLADAFRDCPISDRLAKLADESDGKARDLRRQKAAALNLRLQRAVSQPPPTSHRSSQGGRGR